MACRIIGNAIVCGPARSLPKSCAECGEEAFYQCDFPIAGGKTCDRYLCGKHSWRIVDQKLDYCLDHPLVNIQERLF